MLKGWAGPGRSGMGGGAGPGTWCLGAALRPGGSLACACGVWVALGTPQCGWAGCSGTSDVSTGCLFFFFRVLGHAVGWGDAFPLLGAF